MLHKMFAGKFLVATILLFSFVVDVQAQHPDDASNSVSSSLMISPDADEVLKIFRLRHTQAKSVQGVLEEMGIGDMITVDSSSNTLLVRVGGSEADLLDRLVAQLDRNMPGQRHAETKFVGLSNRDAGQVADLIREVIAGHALRLAVDRTNNLLILSGGLQEIRAASDLIERVDRAQSSMDLKFFFIQGVINGESRGEVKLPAALRGVGEALVANGFGNISLLAPVSVRVQEGSEFSNEGYTGGRVDGTGYAIMVRGSVQKGTEPDTCRVEVKAEIIHADSETTTFSVETTLVARFGDYVILAAAPSDHDDGDAIALVVRVDEASSVRRAQ